MVENITTKELIASIVFSWSVSSRGAFLSTKWPAVLTEYKLLMSTVLTAHLYSNTIMLDTMALVMLTELKALIWNESKSRRIQGKSHVKQ